MLLDPGEDRVSDISPTASATLDSVSPVFCLHPSSFHLFLELALSNHLMPRMCYFSRHSHHLLSILKYTKPLIFWTPVNLNGRDPLAPSFIYPSICVCFVTVLFYFHCSFCKILAGVKYFDHDDGPFKP